MAYQDWFPSKAPAFLQGLWGKRWFTSFGVGFDAIRDAAKAGVKARFPTVAPPDAQDATGFERGLPRIEVLAHELDTAYGPRLQRAWDDLAWARTRTGLGIILDAIRATVVSPFAYSVFEQQTWNPWYAWSRVWVLIQAPHPWVNDGVWGGPGTWGDAGTWGSSATSAQVTNLRVVLKPWLGAHNRGSVVVALDGGVWGEPGTWGDPGTWGGHAVQWPIN